MGDFHSPKITLASPSDTELRIITSSPCFQLAGVTTRCLVVSWSESRTRSSSPKLRPVTFGYATMSLIVLSGLITNTLRTVRLSRAQRELASPETEAGSIP